MRAFALMALVVLACAAAVGMAPGAVRAAWAATTVDASQLDVAISDAVYNGAPQTPVAVSYQGQVLLEGIDYRLDFDEGFDDCVNAGTVKGAIVGMGDEAAEDGYALTGSRAFSFAIEPCTVTVSVMSAGKTYGQPDPALQASLEYDQVFAEVVPWAPAFSLTRTAGEAAGSYAVKVTGPAASPDGNFRAQYRDGAFVIAAAGANEAYVANASALAKTYDGKPLVVQGAATAPGSVLWYSVDGGDWTRTAPSFVDAGSHTVRVKATSDNYEETSPLAAEVTIAKRPATITVASSAKSVGQKDPVFGGTVSGQVAPGDVSVTRYYRANATEKAGTYRGVLRASYRANKNYEVTVKNGTFTITAAEKKAPATPAAAGSGAASPSAGAQLSTNSRAGQGADGASAASAAADDAWRTQLGTEPEGEQTGNPDADSGAEPDGAAVEDAPVSAPDAAPNAPEEVLEDDETPQAESPWLQTGLFFAGAATAVLVLLILVVWMLRRREARHR